LADLYRTLGRKEAMDGLLARVQKLAGADQGQLASFYERTNRLEDAVAIYQRIAEAQSDQADAWQALARIYERQQRYVQAAAAWRGAIAAVESSSARESFRQTIWMRQSLARVLQEAGDTAGADQVYQALLAKSANVQEGERAQILAGYASLLSGSERAAQAEALLTQYRDEHPGQPDDADVQVLMALTTAARAAGHKDAAEEFLQALQAKQERQRERLPVPQPKTISPLFKKAWGALEAGRLEEAASLTLQALDAAPGAPDRDQSPWEVSRIAMGLVNKKAPAKGEQLYQQLFTTVQTWAKDSPTALLAARENYARFLAQQPARSNDVPDAIQKYREELSAVNGGGTGRVAEALHLAIDFEGSKPEGTRSMRPAEELVAFEASLSGTTSQPYEQALVTLAEFYAWAGERERLLALWKQIVSISDLVEPATIQAAFLRMGAAQVYAKQRQFDEADRLAAEAVTIAKKRMPGSRMYETIAQQIREMRDQSLRH
jgi:tetratricopeptide (TPR) repeat protein